MRKHDGYFVNFCTLTPFFHFSNSIESPWDGQGFMLALVFTPAVL